MKGKELRGIRNKKKQSKAGGLEVELEETEIETEIEETNVENVEVKEIEEEN